MTFKDLTASESFIVEWQYRMLGDFKSALVQAIAKADHINTHKLSLGFPDEVEGYRRYTQEDGWWQEVQKKAGIPK